MGRAAPEGSRERFEQLVLARCQPPTLDLCDSQLGADAAAAVARFVRAWNAENPLRPFASVALAGNAVGDRGAAAIAETLIGGGCRIHVLDLQGTDLGPEGFAALLRAVETNDSVAQLNLSFRASSECIGGGSPTRVGLWH
jgi:hypothetical protein